MARQLNDKQEKFAHLIVDGENQTDAYRQAYGCEEWEVESITVAGSKLANSANVSLRIQQLRDELEEARLWTRLDSLKTLKEIAEDTGEGYKNSDRVSAVKAINVMNGWEKKTVDHTSSDGSMSPTRSAAEMGDDELAAIANGDN